MVAGDDQCAETEPAPTFHHLRAAVDEHHFLGGIALLSAITRAIVTSISAFVCHISLCGGANPGLIPTKSALKLQSGGASRVGQCFHLPVKAESSPVEYHCFDVLL